MMSEVKSEDAGENLVESKSTDHSAKDFREQFKSFIEGGMKKLESESKIASFSFGSGKINDNITFTLKEVESSAKKVKPVININIKGEVYDWVATWSIPMGDAAKRDINFRPTYFGWELKVLQVNEGGDSENYLAYKNDFSLRKPPSSDEYFLSSWFGDEKDKTNKLIRTKKLVGGERFPFWKGLKFDGINFDFNASFLPKIPSLNEETGDIDENDELAKEWASFFISLLVWRFILVYCCIDKSKKYDEDEFEKYARKSYRNNLLVSDKDFIKTLYEALPALSDYRPVRPDSYTQI